MIFGISGKAGSGKDTVADLLVKEFGFVKVGLADPLKRICKEVFDFSDEQLWGPSEKRNEPDPRYRRKPALAKRLGELIVEDIQDLTDQEVFQVVDGVYLTPRYALQQLGTEWGRNCFDNVWVNYAIRVANALEKNQILYSTTRGPLWGKGGSNIKAPAGVVIPDVRFKNEVDGLKRAGAVLIRVKRPNAGLEGAAATHASEAEQDGIPDDAFDIILDNSGDLIELHLKVKQIMRMLKGEAQTEKAADSFAQMLGAIPEGGIVTSLKQSFDPDSGVVQEKLEVKMEGVLTTLSSFIAVEDDRLVPGKLTAHESSVEEVPLTAAEGSRLSGLLKQREADIKAGRLMEYDESQKNVPPFKRRK